MISYKLDEHVSNSGTISHVNVPHIMFQQMHNMIELNAHCYIDVYHEVPDEQLKPSDRRRVNNAINDLAILAATAHSSIAALGRKLCPLHLAELIIVMVGRDGFEQAEKYRNSGDAS